MRARENPFASRYVDRLRFRMPSFTWSSCLERLVKMRYRAAVVGAEGSGKTTWLDELAERLLSQNCSVRRITLAEGMSVAEMRTALSIPIVADEILLLDGCEQMNFVLWRWFLWKTRRAAGLIATLHRAGRLPTLLRCETSVDLLVELVTELLDQPAALLRPTAERLFAEHRGNIREALRHWYDLVL